jgi:predicted nucleotidyltransferase
VERTLNKIISYAVNICDPEMIILFGSMAGSGYDVFSDMDLLVITENSICKKDSARSIESYINEFSLKADILIYSRKELEAETVIPYSFMQGVYNSGRIVYQK